MLTILYFLLSFLVLALDVPFSGPVHVLLLWYFLFLALVSFLLNYRRGLFGYTDLFSPKNIFINTFGLYFGLGMMFSERVEEGPVLYIILCLLVAMLIYMVSKKRILREPPGLFINFKLKPGCKLKWRVVGLVTGGFVLFTFLAYQAGFSGPFGPIASPWQFRQFANSKGYSYINLAANFFVYSCFLVLVLMVISRERPFRGRLLLLFYSGITFVFLALSSGVRGVLVFGLLALLLSRHIIVKRINNGVLIFVVFALAPVVVVLGEARALGVHENLSIDQAYNLIKSLDLSNVGAALMARLDSYGNFAYLMHWVTHATDLNFKWGSSYLAAPLQAVPRSIWPEKPLLPNDELTHMLFPEYTNYTVDFSIFGEVYINFWWIGVLFVGSILGFLLVIMQRMYEHALAIKTPIAVVYVTLFWLFPMTVVVTGLVPGFIAACISIATLYGYRLVFFEKVQLYGSNREA
ncbi:oligosaccharide repeat unit polymerase [Thermithiobacillus plumbiphilus]|uniref:O-antigen polysaccharide polymerase Wzy n=1 Tax=Thermithiobacillus plumbiphilus TaxID=1729899 RepID=A0ABU9D8B0_9PROT